jgi:hypothetical protein
MKHPARAILLLAAVLLAGCGRPADDGRLLISVKDGQHCEVGGKPMLCSEVVRYLRDVLGTGPTTPLRLLHPPPRSTEARATAFRLFVEIGTAKVGDFGGRVSRITMDPQGSPQGQHK